MIVRQVSICCILLLIASFFGCEVDFEDPYNGGEKSTKLELAAEVLAVLHDEPEAVVILSSGMCLSCISEAHWGDVKHPPTLVLLG